MAIAWINSMIAFELQGNGERHRLCLALPPIISAICAFRGTTQSGSLWRKWRDKRGVKTKTG